MPKTAFQSGYTSIYIPSSYVWKLPLLHSPSALCIVSLCTLSYSGGYVVVARCGFNLHFLINEGKHLLISLLAIGYPLLWSPYVSSCFYWAVFFLLIDWSPWHILETSPLLVICYKFLLFFNGIFWWEVINFNVVIIYQSFPLWLMLFVLKDYFFYTKFMKILPILSSRIFLPFSHIYVKQKICIYIFVIYLEMICVWCEVGVVLSFSVWIPFFPAWFIKKGCYFPTALQFPMVVNRVSIYV